MIAHYLYDRAAVMRCRSITQLVDSFDDRIKGGIEADRIISSRAVVIDRCRYADAADSLIAQCRSSTVGSVSSKTDQRINAGLLHLLDRLILDLRIDEFRKPGRS